MSGIEFNLTVTCVYVLKGVGGESFLLVLAEICVFTLPGLAREGSYEHTNKKILFENQRRNNINIKEQHFMIQLWSFGEDTTDARKCK